jgi:hypothetical protein
MDPMLAALMRVLIRQTYYTDDDPDNDAGSDCEMYDTLLTLPASFYQLPEAKPS